MSDTGASVLENLTSSASGSVAYVEQDWNFLSGTLNSQITYSRSSLAWYFDSTGLLTTVPHNLFTQSETFDAAAWTKTSVTISANAANDPLTGALTADKMAEVAASANHEIVHSITVVAGVTYTFSVYAKAVERSYLRMVASSGFFGASNQAWFNLASGTLGTVQGATTATITSVGSGWYRCTYTRTATASGGAGFFIGTADADASLTYLGVAGSGILIWGAQLEQQTSSILARAYNPTVASAYHAPVFEYGYHAASGAWVPQGLRVEEARTNLILSSGDLMGSGWSTANIGTRTANAAVAPDGTTTATLLGDTSTSISNYTDRAPTIPGTDSNWYTWSLFVKSSGSSDMCQLRVYMTGGTTGLGTGVGANFVFSTKTLNTPTGIGGQGTPTAADGGVIDVGNGWFRIWVRIQNNNTGNVNLTCRIFPQNASLAATGTIYAWGGQAELGTTPSSYIPTTTASVTRNVDLPIVSSVPWLNPAAGTFVAEFMDPAIAAATFLQTVFSADDATSNERFTLRASGGTTNAIIVDGGATQASIQLINPIVAGTIYRVSFAYTLNDIAASLNGGVVGTDAAATLPTVTRLTLGERLTGNDVLTGYLRRWQYYPTRRTDADLRVLSLATVTGAVATTLGTCTSSASGSTVTGTGAATLAACTSTASGVRGETGTGASTLAACTSSASGSAVKGTAAGTLAACTSSASGARGAAGTASGTLAALTSSATGSSVTGTATASLGTLTSAAAGAPGAGGSVTAELAPVTGAATGIVVVTGPASLSLDDLTATASGIHIEPRIGLGEGYVSDTLSVSAGTVTWPPPRVRQVTLHATIRGYTRAA